MTITSYYVQHEAGRADPDARAAIHLINDLAFSTGDNRSWDATRALVDSMLDAAAQDRLGVRIVAADAEAATDD